jgi:hypothetical protein
VRSTARLLVREHALDEPGRDGLRTLIGAVERSWYDEGQHTVTEDDPQAVADALDEVRHSMRRCAPAPARARLLPRSVLRSPATVSDVRTAQVPARPTRRGGDPPP